ncbi:MAG: 4-alpha-glucanotransferase [Gallionellaceae bacterium]|jgi:4-alpha-glucanotransferase|nr:4-alpha-glucanotransferase [Gallionellaceae bacterium]
MRRASGILLHPTSLPGAFGAGDFGIDAYRFIDWLAEAGQTCWQILPLGEIGPGNSPYMSSSAFAGSVLLIDLIELASQGWLVAEDLVPDPAFQDERVDYPRVGEFRQERLRRAARRFFNESASLAPNTPSPVRGEGWGEGEEGAAASPPLPNPSDETTSHSTKPASGQVAGYPAGGEGLHRDARSAALHDEYEIFCQTERAWLDDYALFMAIAASGYGHDWNAWPAPLAGREPSALQQAEHDHANEIAFWKFCQWCFARQWRSLKNYANARGISLIGDVPIFVAQQSADVWAHQALFELDASGRPAVVAGVPPDYFSETGQMWGNPLYRWDAHAQTGYAWWLARLRHAFTQANRVRIDHFRGFAAYWQIPADAPNAMTGAWVEGPGKDFFTAVQRAFPDLPIIAEDLGLITPDVLELRDEFHLPGMRVLQFAFGDDEDNYFLPHHYIANTVAYTGTHDNDTTVGWWQSAPPHVREFAQRYLDTDGENIQWTMMRALSASVADTVIFPMQDVLGLPSDGRMNFPGKPEGNWAWRFQWEQIQPEYAQRLAEMATRRPDGA